MVQIIAARNGLPAPGTLAAALAWLYALGIKPDRWQLEPQPGRDAWTEIGRTISANDPYCRGIVLGGDGTLDDWGETVSDRRELRSSTWICVGTRAIRRRCTTLVQRQAER